MRVRACVYIHACKVCMCVLVHVCVCVCVCVCPVVLSGCMVIVVSYESLSLLPVGGAFIKG